MFRRDRFKIMRLEPFEPLADQADMDRTAQRQAEAARALGTRHLLHRANALRRREGRREVYL